MKNDTKNNESPVCDIDCFYAGGMFGGKHVCDALEECWGPGEPVEVGEQCLHPVKRDFNYTSFTMSSIGFCDALAGAVVRGGEHDNSKLVQTLTGKYDSSKS